MRFRRNIQTSTFKILINLTFNDNSFCSDHPEIQTAEPKKKNLTCTQNRRIYDDTAATDML